MRNYTDLILLVVYLYTAFNYLTKKDSVGKKKQHLYTRESRKKLAMYEACIFFALSAFTAVFALGNYGIVDFTINRWVYWSIILAVGVVGSLVLEKAVLVKSKEGIDATTSKDTTDGVEDF